MTARRQVGLLWGAVSLALIGLSPFAARMVAVLPSCLLKSWLELPCPTCGTTRAALALARFDLPGALAVQPLATLAWIALIGGGLAAGSMAAAGRPLAAPGLRPTRSLRLAIALALLTNWAYLVAAGV